MSEWFKDWFASEEYLNVYRHRNKEDAKKILELILGNVKLKSGSKILDAACGAGRHSIYLAQRGFDVTGFDLSKTLLKKAKADSENKSLKLNLFCADLRRVCLSKKFDLIINLFTSFGYFDNDEENFIFPKIAFEHLETCGFYVLDYMNKNFVVSNLIPESRRKIDNKDVIEKRRIENNRVIKEIKIIKPGNEKRFEESVRLYNIDEITGKFEKIGFSIDKIFGNYDGSDFNYVTSQRLIVFFKK